MNRILRRMFFLSLVALLTNCGRYVESDLPAQQSFDKQSVVNSSLQGTLNISDGMAIDLAGSNLPILLVFASDSCEVCSHETDQLVQYFDSKGGIPTNALIITHLVGANLNDVQDWDDLHRVPWPISFGAGDALFKKLCPEKKTPCLIISKPFQTTLQKYLGEVEISKLNQETGPWIF